MGAGRKRRAGSVRGAWLAQVDRLRRRLSGNKAPFNLVAHFSYHRCLTVYYQRVMSALAREFHFQWIDCGDDSSWFRRAAIDGKGPRVVALGNSADVPWEELADFRGSHFIRDPRDMVVSGYWYHLWTDEAWCVSPDFAWERYAPHAMFRWVDPEASCVPSGVSYREYLKSLSPERGLILEMVFQHWIFDQMRSWNFTNPNILELRYEDVVGDEAAAFGRLFDHYGFSARMRKRGIQIARDFRLDRQPTGERQHTRSGERGQWKQQFTPKVTQLFKQVNGDVLLRLGYESDLNW